MVPPDPITCETARALQSRLVEGKISAADGQLLAQLLAQHNQQCAACAEELKDPLALAAGLVRKERINPGERWAIRQAYAHSRSRSRSLRMAPGGKRSLLYFFAGVSLLFGSFLFWFSGGTSWFAAGSPQLTSLQGRVQLSGAPVLKGEECEVPVGRVVDIGPDSSARIVRGKASIQLADTTSLLMEGHEPLTVNLVRGWTRCVGPCQVRTPLGLVILDAGDDVLVIVTDSQVTLEGMGGAALANTASLSRTVAQGEILRLPR